MRRTWHGAGYAFEPVTSVALGGGRIALVSTGENDDAGHASPGLSAVHCLVRRRRPPADRRALVRNRHRRFDGLRDQPLGRDPRPLALADLYTRRRHLAGLHDHLRDLTELRPDGAIDIADFPVAYADGKTGWPNAGRIEAKWPRRPRRQLRHPLHGTTRLSET